MRPRSAVLSISPNVYSSYLHIIRHALGVSFVNERGLWGGEKEGGRGKGGDTKGMDVDSVRWQNEVGPDYMLIHTHLSLPLRLYTYLNRVSKSLLVLKS